MFGICWTPEPECFHPLFPHALEVLQAGGGLTFFRRLGDHVLIAFDGTAAWSRMRSRRR